MNKDYERLKVSSDNEIDAYKRLKAIMGVLRKECPWDKAQTHESLRACMIEEAYEAAEAIDRKDIPNLKEELGDVFLQVIFHSLLAEESKTFDMTEILNEESEKMIRRHPHIFCDEDAKTVDKVLEKWENIKASEHSECNLTVRLKEVPVALPALLRAKKVQKKANFVGFDFESLDEALQRLVEETEELKEAYKQSNLADFENEFGDILFSLVNIARFMNVEPESALEKTINKFISRIDFIESNIEKRGMRLENVALEDMNLLWENAKKQGL